MSSNVGDTTATSILTDTPMHGNTEAAIPGLLDEIVVTHILRFDFFDDPARLARLQAVSRAMRDALVESGQLEMLE